MAAIIVTCDIMQNANIRMKKKNVDGVPWNNEAQAGARHVQIHSIRYNRCVT